MNIILCLPPRACISLSDRKYASFILWLSPPDRVLLLCPSFMYERPTSASGFSLSAIRFAVASGWLPKKSMASSTLMFRISSIFLPLYLTSRISGLNLLPPQASHVMVTSAMNCIPILTKPSPWHSGHLPPSILKEKNDGV